MRNSRARLILDVDTGTDDAGALLMASTFPGLMLEAALATWGNCSRDRAARNTLAILEAAGRTDVPVYRGCDRPRGPTAVVDGAEMVMGRDGLGEVDVADPDGSPTSEPAASALVRMTAESPGHLTLIALAPLTTLAAALDLDPSLPGRLHQLIVMGGAIRVAGNSTPAAEANIGHDPEAAAKVIRAFGSPGALASGHLPQLVPLDVTLPSALTAAELDALRASPLPGADLLHRIWQAVWPSGRLETGRDDVWPAHDLLASWCVVDPLVCQWSAVPLDVDTGGSAAWGATVADLRVVRWPGRQTAASGATWDIALGVDTARFHAGVRAWLSGRADTEGLPEALSEPARAADP
ncbi:MAG TPA: nucleoside hydrolase [Acidimicrobiales bacterium]